MSRQKAVSKMATKKMVAKKVTRKKTSKEKPIRFFKEDGKTKPITKSRKKAKNQKVVTKFGPDEYMSKEAYEGGRKAHLTLSNVGKDGETVTIDIIPLGDNENRETGLGL